MLGLLTRPVAAALAGTMVVAIVTAHPDAFFLPKGMAIINTMNAALKDELDAMGYQEISTPTEIQSDRSPARIWVIPTNEELEIAEQTYSVISNLS